LPSNDVPVVLTRDRNSPGCLRAETKVFAEAAEATTSAEAQTAASRIDLSTVELQVNSLGAVDTGCAKDA